MEPTLHALIGSVYADRVSRVEARMLSGSRCCLAGLVLHGPDYSFPACYMVRDALLDDQWIKMVHDVDVAADESIISRDTDTGMAIVRLNKPATCIVFANHELASPWDPIGLHGGVVTVLFTPIAAEVFQDIPCMVLDEIETPPPPSPR